MSMDGLAKILSNDEMLRSKLLKTDSLVSWPDPKMVGVCKNPDSQRLNLHLLKVVADFWCPQWEGPIMIPIDELKREVGRQKTKLTFSNFFWMNRVRVDTSCSPVPQSDFKN